jgi:hypothetical protein
MIGVAAATSLAGFLTTFTLLHLQVQPMWVRYGLSVVVAYGVFLLLVRAWIRHYRSHPADVPVLQLVHRDESKSEFGWRDLLDFGDVLDFLECGGIITVILIVVLSVTCLYLIASTAILIPEFIAELVVDGVIGATVYRQLRPSPVRRTVAPFLCLLALFICAGLVCHAYAPEATSIGGVIRHAVQAR